MVSSDGLQEIHNLLKGIAHDAPALAEELPPTQLAGFIQSLDRLDGMAAEVQTEDQLQELIRTLRETVKAIPGLAYLLPKSDVCYRTFDEDAVFAARGAGLATQQVPQLRNEMARIREKLSDASSASGQGGAIKAGPQQ